MILFKRCTAVRYHQTPSQRLKSIFSCKTLLFSLLSLFVYPFKNCGFPLYIFTIVKKVASHNSRCYFFRQYGNRKTTARFEPWLSVYNDLFFDFFGIGVIYNANSRLLCKPFSLFKLRLSVDRNNSYAPIFA